jgi:moderate conductance mechanosensitive channel
MSVPALTTVLGQTERAAEALRVCSPTGDPDGADAGTWCKLLYQGTGNEWIATNLWGMLSAVIQILIIIAVAYVANRALKRFIKRFVRSMADQGLQRLGALQGRAPLSETRPIDLARATMRTETIGGVLRSLSTFVIWSIAALMILGTLGINLGPLIAGAGIAGIALGFGAQNLVKDFLSGIFMLLEDQYGIGDIVDVGDATGTVEAISLRTTRLRDLYGVVWHVPNGEIRRVGNKSQQWARALLDIGVAYETPIPKAIDVIKRVADDVWQDPEWADKVLEEPDVWGVENFGDSEITIRLVVKVQPLQQWKVERELRRRLKAAFDDAGIEIPFPQRTMWLRDGHRDNGADASRNPFNVSETIEK